MTAARRLVTGYPLDRLARNAAPPPSAGAREMAPGTARLGAPTSRKTPRSLAAVGDGAVQVVETSALGSGVVTGQEYPATELGRDALGNDWFAEDPAHLRWLGRLICWMTATSTLAMILWVLVG
jgi:hypothetical protein